MTTRTDRAGSKDPAIAGLDVRAMAAHLTARFVENGVPLDDVQATVETLDRWEDWCAAWERTADANADRAQHAAAVGALQSAAELNLVAALEYHFGKFLFVHDPEALAKMEKRAVACYQDAVPVLPWPGRRVVVPFEDLELPGILRLPDSAAGPAPAVIVVPGLDATKEEMHRFCDVFLRRGIATFAVDGPGQGELDLSSVLRPDWEQVATAIVDVVGACPEVDAARIGAVGVSLGGYFVCRAATSERRLQAVACIGGCFDFGGSWSTLSLLSRQAFAVRSGAAAANADAEERARSFTLDGAEPLGGAPILVVHGARDGLFLPEQAEAIHRHFGERSQLVMEPRGNHVLHNLAYRVRPAVADWIGDALQI